MVFQNTHHPTLILEATKKTCHLPRNNCDNITTVTRKVCSLSIIHNKFQGEVFMFRYLHFENSHLSEFLKTLIIIEKTAG